MACSYGGPAGISGVVQARAEMRHADAIARAYAAARDLITLKRQLVWQCTCDADYGSDARQSLSRT